jgi:hypothetical protein
LSGSPDAPPLSADACFIACALGYFEDEAGDVLRRSLLTKDEARCMAADGVTPPD